MMKYSEKEWNSFSDVINYHHIYLHTSTSSHALVTQCHDISLLYKYSAARDAHTHTHTQKKT